MRISNMLHFTENHPFYTGRFFAMGSLHYTVLHSVYQPMIGTMATSLYHVLYEMLPAHQVGYSPIEQQRKLFLSLQLEQGTEGRRKLIDAASRLEAVGLLHTVRSYMQQEEDYLYHYQLSPPLLPHDFFASHHLVYLLRDTIGSSALIRLKERLFAPSPIGDANVIAQEDVTMPFYELFRISPEQTSADVELVMDELAAGTEPRNAQETQQAVGFAYADIVTRFPRASRNRKFIERLERREDQLTFINYTAAKYRLELHELCRLLDEDGLFDEAGELHEDILTYRASLSYMQFHRRREEREVIIQRKQAPIETDEPMEERAVDDQHQLDIPELFTGKCNKPQYNLMLRNEPYTAMLERFFQGKPSTHVVKVFEHIHINYKMPDEVLNVIMHYIHTNKLSWSRAFVDSLFTDLLAREVQTFEAAVAYMRERIKIAEKGKERAAGKGARTTGSRAKKPSPAIVMNNVPDEPISDEEYERILQEVRSIQSRLK